MMDDAAWLSKELAECADELAYWKYAAIYLQVATVLGRLPTVEDESGKTWNVMRTKLEAQYLAEKTAR